MAEYVAVVDAKYEGCADPINDQAGVVLHGDVYVRDSHMSAVIEEHA
jgi:hypothetical protein